VTPRLGIISLDRSETGVNGGGSGRILILGPSNDGDSDRARLIPFTPLHDTSSPGVLTVSTIDHIFGFSPSCLLGLPSSETQYQIREFMKDETPIFLKHSLHSTAVKLQQLKAKKAHLS
jgi:hypothetical protein